METILCGDALEQLRNLEAESIHTCVTSPPYYNLRDYGAAGQIGMENTPEEYITMQPRSTSALSKPRNTMSRTLSNWGTLSRS